MSTFLRLQDELRRHIRSRIRRGDLTGSALARQSGFPQGHLSNFLHSRRGLSLDSMDRLLKALRIGVLDLVGSDEIQGRTLEIPGNPGLQPVAVVSARHAALPRFAPQQVLETRGFNPSFLRRLKPHNPRHPDDRRDWLRFVVIKLDAAGTRTLFPFAASAATLLLDRHYNSLQPYRRARPNLYAVRVAQRCLVGYASLFGNQLVVRPQDPRHQLQVIEIPRGRSYCDYIIGRVCHVALEI